MITKDSIEINFNEINMNWQFYDDEQHDIRECKGILLLWLY